ncbi:MAG: hypothetical protein PHC56_11450 [Herbinix sp.]|nr:hypothetical protein [Herbinix sp.]
MVFGPAASTLSMVKKRPFASAASPIPYALTSFFLSSYENTKGRY